MKDLANVLSKFINMGMSASGCNRRATWTPANVINKTELGNLSVGAEADIAVFNVRKGDFGFVDVRGTKLKGTQKLETELTIRAGKIVWDLNGISAPSLGCKINMIDIHMNQSMNVFTAKTLRRKGICRYYRKIA